MKWDMVKFSDVIRIQNGRDHKRVNNPNGKYPIIGSGGIMGYADEYLCEGNCTIIGRKGSINNPLFLKQKFWNVDTAFALVPGDLVHPKYFYYFCLTYNFEKHNKATTLPSLTKTDLAEITFPLPPLPIQKRIAEILDAADALRKKDQELLKKYDELAQAIFIDMFGDPVKNEKGWEVKKLGDVFNVASGGTPATTNPDYWTDGYIPWIGSNMCKDSIIRETDGKYITEDGLNNSSARIFAKGTVIVALVGATIGKVGLIELDCSTNQNVAGLQILPKSEVNSIFSFYMMKNLYYKFDELGGDKFKMANLSFVRGLPFWLPPLKLQEKFKAKISLLTNQRDFLLVYQNLKLFESLLQKAFSGDLVS